MSDDQIRLAAFDWLKGIIDLIVRNGLSLCKIHHAAFDRNIIPIPNDPDNTTKNSSGPAEIKLLERGSDGFSNADPA